MGCKPSTPEASTSKEIARSVAEKQKKEAQVKKLLLLGAGGSGKSTFFKQINEIHGKGLDEAGRKKYKDSVHDNVIVCIQFLLEKAMEQNIKFNSVLLNETAMEISTKPSDVVVDGKLAKQIELLWQTSEIQKLFEHYTEREGNGTIHPSTRWFFENLERISKKEYIPSVEDVIRVRFRTTGIVEQEFDVTQRGQTLSFRMFDVGGQQSERRKWIHCFENVTGVLFVSSLTGYNEAMWEANDKNRMEDSLSLFDNICNSRWFKDSAMIIFLNKYDLFVKRISEVPLTVCPAFEKLKDSHAHDPIGAINAIKNAFKAKKRRYNKEIFIHETIAIDSKNVEKIFNSIRMQILQDNLADCGLA